MQIASLTQLGCNSDSICCLATLNTENSGCNHFWGQKINRLKETNRNEWNKSQSGVFKLNMLVVELLYKSSMTLVFVGWDTTPYGRITAAGISFPNPTLAPEILPSRYYHRCVKNIVEGNDWRKVVISHVVFAAHLIGSSSHFGAKAEHLKNKMSLIVLILFPSSWAEVASIALTLGRNGSYYFSLSRGLYNTSMVDSGECK